MLTEPVKIVHHMSVIVKLVTSVIQFIIVNCVKLDHLLLLIKLVVFQLVHQHNTQALLKEIILVWSVLLFFTDALIVLTKLLVLLVTKQLSCNRVYVLKDVHLGIILNQFKILVLLNVLLMLITLTSQLIMF